MLRAGCDSYPCCGSRRGSVTVSTEMRQPSLSLVTVTRPASSGGTLTSTPSALQINGRAATLFGRIIPAGRGDAAAALAGASSSGYSSARVLSTASIGPSRSATAATAAGRFSSGTWAWMMSASSPSASVDLGLTRTWYAFSKYCALVTLVSSMMTSLVDLGSGQDSAF